MIIDAWDLQTIDALDDELAFPIRSANVAVEPVGRYSVRLAERPGQHRMCQVRGGCEDSSAADGCGPIRLVREGLKSWVAAASEAQR